MVWLQAARRPLVCAKHLGMVIRLLNQPLTQLALVRVCRPSHQTHVDLAPAPGARAPRRNIEQKFSSVSWRAWAAGCINLPQPIGHGIARLNTCWGARSTKPSDQAARTEYARALMWMQQRPMSASSARARTRGACLLGPFKLAAFKLMGQDQDPAQSTNTSITGRTSIRKVT